MAAGGLAANGGLDEMGACLVVKAFLFVL